MPHTWKKALNGYFYPVDLCLYDRRLEFPGFFELHIHGNRESTIIFENHFRQLGPHHDEAFFEVVFWKLFSQPNRRKRETDRRVDHVRGHNIAPMALWSTVISFVHEQTVGNLQAIRQHLGIRADVLAIPLTFPALASPETLPMVDRQTAQWVNANHIDHNVHRMHQLTTFNMNYTSLRDNDFPHYLNWVAWCRELAGVLTDRADFHWRPRDVEMAVFTAQRNGMRLNPLN